MSAVMDEAIKRWTARRKSALVLEIIQGKTTVAEASRQFDLTPAEVESWVEDGKRGMENALRAKPEDVRQLKGWQVRKRAMGRRPRIQALPSVATAPDQRWATDLCRVWGGRDDWLTLALVIDCHTRQLLGWHLSRSGKASTAVAALEQALIARYGTLGRVPEPFLLRSDNGLVFTSRDYTRLVRSYGLQQEFITPHCPQQNGMVERLIRTLKEQCVHRHRFESQQHAMRMLGDWIQFYNHRRPHQALGMKTPAQAYALAA